MLGGNNEEAALSVDVTTANTYIVTGFTYSTDIPDVVSNGGTDMFTFELVDPGY